MASLARVLFQRVLASLKPRKAFQAGDLGRSLHKSIIGFQLFSDYCFDILMMHEKASLMKVNFSLKLLLIYRGVVISMQLFLLHYHLIILTPF